MAKKKISTVEDLAIAMKNGFSEVHQEFSEIHKEFEGVHKEFEGVHKEFKEIHKEIEGLALMTQKEFSRIYAEILNIKSDLEDIKLRMGEMAFRFEIQDLERRLKKVEIKLGLK
jgi:uncharacterized coiled-coil DUF342 family protein